MIKLEKTNVMGWEDAIRGMRNPLNSWDKSDSHICTASTTDECADCNNLLRQPGEFSWCTQPFILGPNDHDLMMRLRRAGSDHRKFMRMIVVYVDITAPLYWWKEFDTYKVGTVANSCSTMHKIHATEFGLADFSCEKLMSDDIKKDVNRYIHFCDPMLPIGVLEIVVAELNFCRNKFLETKDKLWWDRMIQLLPSSYNQKRTIMFNYEVLANIYKSRKNHKLDEWRELCKWIETLPYSELITTYEVKDTFDGALNSYIGLATEEELKKLYERIGEKFKEKES